jgi:predicted  nucleic acid-binding Zn-ribbon protein
MNQPTFINARKKSEEEINHDNKIERMRAKINHAGDRLQELKDKKRSYQEGMESEPEKILFKNLGQSDQKLLKTIADLKSQINLMNKKYIKLKSEQTSVQGAASNQNDMFYH